MKPRPRMARTLYFGIDGVLNNAAHYHRVLAEKGPRLLPQDLICRHRMKLLSDLVVRQGYDAVLTSSWRCGKTIEELDAILAACGAEFSLSGKTPDFAPEIFRSDERADEIVAYRESRGLGFMEPRVVLDSSSTVDPCLVRTSFRDGLTERDVGLVIASMVSQQNRIG